MALSIRNLTAHPLELTSVERLESEKVPAGNVFKSLGGSISGFLNATTTTTTTTTVAIAQPSSAAQPLRVRVPPFHTVETDVRPADAARRETLRLALRVAVDDLECAYEADVPGASRRAAGLRRVHVGPGADLGPDLTALYVPSESLLAVFCSTVFPAPSSSSSGSVVSKSSSGSAGGELSAWMAPLHDRWPLSALSIPGTHNSAACHTALPSVRCQAASVAEQLRQGVRFLDVRVSVPAAGSGSSGGGLALVHSAFPVALAGARYLADLVEDVYRFLDAHPSESVLMSVKREGTGRGSDYDLGWCLKREYVDRRRDRWWTEPAMPVLGRARGRIVVLRRFALDPAMREACWGGRGWGIEATPWPDNCADGRVGDAGCELRVQDFYEVGESEAVARKIALSAAQLERAAEQAFDVDGVEAPPFFVNFLSASNFFNAACWPERIAAKVNPAMVDYLCARHGRKGKGPEGLAVGLAGTGIVVTDWVGVHDDWDLIRCVVGMNARLQQMKLDGVE